MRCPSFLLHSQVPGDAGEGERRRQWEGKKEEKEMEGLHVIVCVGVCKCVFLCVCVCPSTYDVPDIRRCVLLQCVKESRLHAANRHSVTD